MPIRPENKVLYPVHWPMISAAVKFRAGNRCEGSPDFPDCRAANGKPHPDTGSIVVLTTAHLDQDPQNNDGMLPGELARPIDESNLRCWCQRCHLNYDKLQHVQTRYRTSRAGRAVMDLFTEVFNG
jgi:hypothetical protein